VSFDTVYGKRAMLFLLAGPAASAPAGQRTAELRQPRPVTTGGSGVRIETAKRNDERRSRQCRASVDAAWEPPVWIFSAAPRNLEV
jgi:hypothetical protein